MVPTIDRFHENFFFLSNFAPCAPGTVFLHFGLCGDDSRWWPTVEHAYHASKTRNALERDVIAKSRTPAQAKRLGQTIRLRPDWDEVKRDVMFHLLEQKFKDPALRHLLLSTGDAVLIEGNYWNDTYWGVCNGTGTNHLGRLLELVRYHIHHPELSESVLRCKGEQSEP